MLAPAMVTEPTSTATAGGMTTTEIGLGLAEDIEAAPAMAMVISGTPSVLAEEVTPPTTEVEAS